MLWYRSSNSRRRRAPNIGSSLVANASAIVPAALSNLQPRVVQQGSLLAHVIIEHSAVRLQGRSQAVERPGRARMEAHKQPVKLEDTLVVLGVVRLERFQQVIEIARIPAHRCEEILVFLRMVQLTREVVYVVQREDQQVEVGFGMPSRNVSKDLLQKTKYLCKGAMLLPDDLNGAALGSWTGGDRLMSGPLMDSLISNFPAGVSRGG
jgi:hypothetical protein